MFNTLVTYYSVHSLQIFTIAFFTTFTRCVTVGEGISNSVIYKYILNTNKVGTRLSGLAVLLKALNAIYKTTSLSILGSLMTII